MPDIKMLVPTFKRASVTIVATAKDESKQTSQWSTSSRKYTCLHC
jgi:hypothetical protein